MPNDGANVENACGGCFDMTWRPTSWLTEISTQRAHHDSGRNCFREVARTIEAPISFR